LNIKAKLLIKQADFRRLSLWKKDFNVCGKA